ncbi:thioredoxin-like protein [Guyanagaster necrorhizus]|uniref:Thioredoxin-like protein n=1 Tax=Guyanagaster necrorhizus TaxID=856835 RepID=A0A9P8AUG2_9AGAR|nr:thioredoxin-like protein [Guyanagaster necrorhizus MCA 3950]KAG7448459.1 thioredoxin-like protein [Guyanagaster necrorhizus MCA 3950]
MSSPSAHAFRPRFLFRLAYDIESLVLSGELFNGTSRSSSPIRTPSPSSDKGWHDDEIDSSNATVPPEPQQDSIGMGPGRTGVKGVIRDCHEAETLERQRQAKEMAELRTRMEKSSLGGKSYLEEEREKADRGDENVDPLVRNERERRDFFGMVRQGKFGHLREVGVRTFVQAVEKEDKAAWVIVHLYEPSLDRCYSLDETLSRLARSHPDTKFLRCRASALGFASSGSAVTKSTTHRPSRSIREDDDDPYSDKDDDHDEDDYDSDEQNHYAEEDVDLDMLPTMLVYRDGQLIHNWVRVDWEAGAAGIDELLEKNRILRPAESFLGRDNFGLPSDDEDDDLLWDEER